MTPTKDPNLDPGDPNDTVKRYNLYELQTTGWEIVEIDGEVCANLTKETCNHWMQILLDSGTAPDRIKVNRVV